MVAVSAVSFANNYSATNATVAISGMKVLNVTNSDLSLTDNQFKFKIEALGSNTDGSDTFVRDDTQPMPTTTEITNIANGDVLFADYFYLAFLQAFACGFECNLARLFGRRNNCSHHTTENVHVWLLERFERCGVAISSGTIIALAFHLERNLVIYLYIVASKLYRCEGREYRLASDGI